MVEIKPPELEALLGVSTYKTDTPGVGGRLKESPEDFVVEEIGKDMQVASVDGEVEGDDAPGEFTHFTLVKKNWDTMRAIKELSRRVGVSQMRFSFAGTKDKQAVTAQRVSVSGVPIEELAAARLSDVSLKDFSYADYPVKLGDLWGNSFRIVIREVQMPGEEAVKNVEATAKSLSSGFPNFFGLQRFGIVRPITHVVGKKIIHGDLEGAVKTYLAETFDEVEAKEKKARENLAGSWDLKAALKDFPGRLGYEKAMLNHLVEHPDDFAGAIGRLPANLQTMFVHAYQAFIFNKALSACMIEGAFVERLPLVGYESVPDAVTEGILEEEGVCLEDFRVNAMRRLSSRGSMRECFKEMVDFSVVESSPLTLGFSLPAGCYATVVAREFMKNRYW
ncbi:MAG: tRNA pseudouridine(13) synthase TruD [Candidatus Altiarchaeota archaeon]